MLTVINIDGVEMQRNIEIKMLGMKNHFDISSSIEIREVDIAGVACVYICRPLKLFSDNESSLRRFVLKINIPK